MKQKKEENKTKKHSIWWWILVIIIIIFLYMLLFNDIEEYTSCVESCVIDNGFCLLGIYDYNNRDYVKYDDAKGCSDDLEYCVKKCEIHYG